MCVERSFGLALPKALAAEDLLPEDLCARFPWRSLLPWRDIFLPHVRSKNIENDCWSIFVLLRSFFQNVQESSKVIQK